MKKVLFIVAGVFAFIILLNNTCEEELSNAKFNGLIAYFPLNGNAKNIINPNYSGEVYGSLPGQDRFSHYNAAMEFDGTDDYIVVKNIGSLIPTEEITVTMWLKSYVSKAQFQLMLCPDENRFAVSVNYFHDDLNTIFWDYGWRHEGGDSPGRLYYRPEPVDTIWHHYAFTSSLSENKMKIFKDGDLLASKDVPLELMNKEGRDLKIGSGDSNYFFEGLIDELKIFNRALSKFEINQLMNGQK